MREKILWASKMALVVLSLVVFNFIQKTFIRLYCDSYHINVHFIF